MELMHNQTFRILNNSSHALYKEGLYRVIVQDKVGGRTIAVQIDQPAVPTEHRGGRKKIAKTRSLRKKAPPPLVGKLLWMESAELQRMQDAFLLHVVEIEREPVYYRPFKTDVQRMRYSRRIAAMFGFWDLEHLTESILVNGGMGALVRQAMEQHGVSRTHVYKQWSTCSHMIYYSLALDKLPKPLKERDINAKKVLNLLKQQRDSGHPEYGQLCMLFCEITTGDDYKYLNALTNTSKHRSIVRPELNEDATGRREEKWILFLESFWYEGELFEKINVREFMQKEHDRIQPLTVNIGVELNEVLTKLQP